MDDLAYALLYRSLLVRMDAERAHRLSFAALRALDAVPGVRDAVGAVLSAGTHAPVQVLGLPFRNRVGLAAGFDKEGHGIRALSRLGCL